MRVLVLLALILLVFVVEVPAASASSCRSTPVTDTLCFGNSDECRTARGERITGVQIQTNQVVGAGYSQAGAWTDCTASTTGPTTYGATLNPVGQGTTADAYWGHDGNGPPCEIFVGVQTRQPVGTRSESLPCILGSPFDLGWGHIPFVS